MLRPLFNEDLWNDLFDFRRDFDQIFNRLTVGRPFLTEPKLLTGGYFPLVDAWIDKETKKFYLTMTLPGVEPNEVNVLTQGNLLTIKGEIKFAPAKKDIDYFYRELPYGTFERTLTLPEGVDADKLVAEFNHGLLQLSAPMVAGALPHRIEIKGLVKKAA
ncbi:MAG TPA: Hsp20/alpha crystallin family protein [Candidatus Acidoferrales bacterium]|nr:Hsp20/alpha crystallin family protein [Candidatus Acidoferrales bacterium]